MEFDETTDDMFVLSENTPVYSEPIVPYCWFCGGLDGELLFEIEFDTFVHKKCLEEALEKEDEEAEIMSYLLDKEKE